MSFLKIFEKKLNKTLNKGLVAYTNNTRVLNNKRKKIMKNIIPEFKDLMYDFLLYWENPKSTYTIKFFFLLIVTHITVENIYPILNGDHQKMLLGHQIVSDMEAYQTDNLITQKADRSNMDKIMISYWTNYL